MSDYLVIVESPAKARTIQKYLGKRYKVVASMGHVIDLPKSQIGIDIENNFEPKYITIRGKGNILKELKKAAAKAKKVFLAPDPDREGEAISWHLNRALKIGDDSDCRVEFYEITDKAVKEAFKKPRRIDMNMVDAQQARRVLDRLVGYKISPLLWQKIKKGLSAGRVQSVALRLIVEREEEIEKFVPEEFWILDAKLQAKGEITARYYGKNGKKHVPASVKEVEAIKADVVRYAFQVSKVEKKERLKKPPPPFTTSSLQQEASRKLGFTARKTMLLAQQLYEGINLGKEGVVGLITYIRTDATRISAEAHTAARSYIEKEFGDKYLPEKQYRFAAGKSAQEAHEAIRPTAVLRTPQIVSSYLTKDQYRLYKLIWERFLASRMSQAVYDTVKIKITAGPYEFRISGSQIKFEGFMKLYTESQDANESEENSFLPDLREGEKLKLLQLLPDQRFTQPPPRYSEAMLVKVMEEKGIGRPSTYAPIIETLISRGYVLREKKVFIPTELGKVVLEQLLQFFSDIFDVDFTAQMEEKLDEIAAGKLRWVEVIDNFYKNFAKKLKEAENRMQEVIIALEESDELCPNCGKRLVYKTGRYGRFLACPGFPECRYAKPIVKTLEIDCPECGKSLVERKSRRGRTFYGCSGYPECRFTTWNRPQKEKCPKCGYLTVLKGKTLQCANDNCGFVLSKEQSSAKKSKEQKSAARGG
ncbi:MAG: type I DNA topoisomerase [Bacillota bacterium]|jgi:DNA topoisomerase-1|nr:type I DNA topoisomerase [Bacillota bacterium]HHU29506.1 type I DNA topoisomerase [Bacillota bacterium]